MAREMRDSVRKKTDEEIKKDQKIARLIEHYGSEEAVMAAFAKKKETMPKYIGESMPPKPATTAQKLALFQQANPDALMNPDSIYTPGGDAKLRGKSIKDQMNTSGVPNEEEEYDKRTIGTVLGHDPKYKRRGQEGIPLSELEANQAGRIQNKLEKLKWERQVLGIGDPDDRAEIGHMRNEILPGLHKKTDNYKEDTEMSELDRIAKAERDAVMQPSKDMGDIEHQMAGGEQRDIEQEKQRNQSEEFMANASEDEQEEAIAEVISQTDPFSEATAAIKEDTGRYVRYDGATKKGITLNKTRLQELFDRKEKMSLLQHIPQENRAALLFNWGLISKEDLSDTQQQSAKEVLELEKIQLQVAELKNKTGKMSDSQKAQVTAASNALTDAVKNRRWPEAEALQDQLNELMPGRKDLNIGKIQKGIDNKLLALPQLQKVKAEMGAQVWDGYFSFKNDLVNKIDLVKRSKEGSGRLEELLGGTAQAGENKGKTWSDILEGQGFPSWKTIKSLPGGQQQDLAWKLSRGKHKDITKIDRAAYMGYVLPELRQMIMKENYGQWYTRIETELHGAQGEATAQAQSVVNNNQTTQEISRKKEKEEDEGLSEAALEAAKEATLTAEEEAEFTQELSETEAFLRENDRYGLYEGPEGNMRLKNKLVEMIKRKKERETEGEGSVSITPRHGSRRRQ
jgi:hypothetical protein